MSRTKSAFLGTISSQTYVIISVVLSLLSIPIIIKHLNSEVYGISIIIFQITGYFGLFDFGLTAGVERYLAGTKENSDENRQTINRILSTCLVVYTIIAIIVVFFGNIFAPFATKVFNIAPKYGVQNIISIVSIIFGLQIVLRAISGIFFAHQRQLLSNTLTFLLNSSNLLLVIFFVILGKGLWSFVYSSVISFGFYAILNFIFFRKYYPYVKFNLKYFDKKLLNGMFSYGLSLFLISIATQIIFQTDRILVGHYISLVAVSIYSISTKTPELTTQFLWKITDNSFPGIIEALKKNKDSFEKIHYEIMKITMSLSSVCFWFVLVASYPFIRLWVGKNYYAGDFFLISILYLYFIQHTFIHVTSMCLSAAGIVRRISLIYITESVLNVGLSIFLVNRFHLIGVVYGTIIAGLLTSVWFTPSVAISYMKSNPFKYITSILKPMVLSFITSGVLYFVFKSVFININNWIMLFFYSIIFIVISMLPVCFTNRSLIEKILSKNKKS